MNGSMGGAAMYSIINNMTTTTKEPQPQPQAPSNALMTASILKNINSLIIIKRAKRACSPNSNETTRENWHVKSPGQQPTTAEETTQTR